MPIIRRSDCVLLPIVVCPVVAVVMLESRVASCVENVAWLHTVHTARHLTLQHHNTYNRTDNYRQWNAVGSPDDGHKDARNILRYYWLPINHYLLHLVGFFFTYILSKCGTSHYALCRQRDIKDHNSTVCQRGYFTGTSWTATSLGLVMLSHLWVITANLIKRTQVKVHTAIHCDFWDISYTFLIT